MTPQRSLMTATMAVALLFALGAGTRVEAGLYVVAKADLQPPQVTFSEVAPGPGLDGLTINGFTFHESITPTAVVAGAGSGPGDSNNITGAMGLGNGNPPGYVLTVALPQPSTAFGFGYALLASGVIADGVTITLYNGVTNLGSLVYVSSSDPNFPGGFAGIGSTDAFTSAEIVFSAQAVAFAIDNLSATPASVVPEPSTVITASIAGLFGLAYARRQRAR